MTRHAIGECEPFWHQSHSPDGYIDLHLHTTYSDGIFSPEQLVSCALEKKLRAIAVTDHDTVSGVQETIGIAEKHHIQCIPGVEISAYTEEDGEIHILGYFIDTENPFLLDTLHHLKTFRLHRIIHMLERLRDLNIDVPFETVQHFARKSSVIGRPHLARAMVHHGIVSSVDDAFDRYLANGKPGFVRKRGLSYREAIDAILHAGGIPVYAHPGLQQKDHLIPKLLALGLRGLEVFHSKHSPQDVKRYGEMVLRHNLVATGGSDCHGGREQGKPLIGTVCVPYSILEYLEKACTLSS
jgi:hypothetical protein